MTVQCPVSTVQCPAVFLFLFLHSHDDDGGDDDGGDGVGGDGGPRAISITLSVP